MRKELYRLIAGAAVLTASAVATPIAAQDDSNVTAPTSLDQPDAPAASAVRPAGEVIDILVPVPDVPYDPNFDSRCEDEQEAASLSQEIIVCARRRDDSEYRTTSDSRKRYAEETAFINDPQAPEVFGIPNHGTPIKFGRVPPPALIIDVAALPAAPVGSDADRVAHGLPPLGDANPVGDAIVIPTSQAEAEAASTGPVIDYNIPTLSEDAIP